MNYSLISFVLAFLILPYLFVTLAVLQMPLLIGISGAISLAVSSFIVNWMGKVIELLTKIIENNDSETSEIDN